VCFVCIVNAFVDYVRASYLRLCLSRYLPLPSRKTASLGEMIQQLTPLGVRVPGGFGVSSTAYDAVLDRHDLRQRLTSLLEGLDGKHILERLQFGAITCVC
jgi:phosphoenolpyruvate synthase/pyruvate phosphate dikinase